MTNRDEEGLSPTNITPSIRMLIKADASAYRELRLQALSQNPQAFIATFTSERRKSIESFMYELSTAISTPVWGYYGVYIKQKLVGFCQIEPSFAAKQPHICFLYNLYIDPDFRGQGLAKKLMSFVLEKIKSTGKERIFISYLARNRCVRGFYDHFGFVQCGLKPQAAKDGDEYDDEVEMVLEL